MTEPKEADYDWQECPDRCGALLFPPGSKLAGQFHCGGCQITHENVNRKKREN